MGISGYEAFVMSTISPLLLGSKFIKRIVMGNLRIVHLFSLAGVAAFFIRKPELRLAAVGFGVWMSCLGWASSLSSDALNGGRLERKVLALVVGLVLSATAKFAWWTNNPIWPIMHHTNGGLNRSGLVLAIFSALVFTNPSPPSKGAVPQKGGSPTLSAFGLAGLFFGLHSLLSDTSTMILWTWEGYPARGPQAIHGWSTLAAMTIGILAGLFKPHLMTSWVMFLMGCGGAAALTHYSKIEGYMGALVVAFYLMGLSIPLISSAARSKSIAITFGWGFMLYNFMVLFHVWVVAYAFVPGGPFVREHTDWIMMSMMGLIGMGVFDINSHSSHGSKSCGTEPSLSHRSLFGTALVIINSLFLAATYMRIPKSEPIPYHAPEKLITAGIWTVHFSLDNDMWSSERRMAKLIKELEIDVMGLLETDQQRIIMGNRDTTQYLAETLGMFVDYGPGPNKHTWGASLLSKFPIINSTHHLLPSPVGELAPAIHATIEAYGELIDVFVFHSGQEEDKEDRRLQAEYMAQLMGSTSRPAFLLSYLVTKPHVGNYNTYVSEISGMKDVDQSDWDRWCQYILYKKLKRVGYARVSRGTITDTELQAAKFVVPTTLAEKGEVKFLEEKEKLRNRRQMEHRMPEGLKWPVKFKGRGKRGHRYHVFKEPRYFDPGTGVVSSYGPTTGA